MTDLAANFNRPSAGQLPYIQPLPVKDGENILRGALVAIDGDGLAVEAADTAGLKVAGVCVKEYDNTDGLDGTLAPAARWCQVQRGLWSFAVAGTPIAGASVYVVDTDNLTTVAGNVAAGTCWEPDPDTTGNWFCFIRGRDTGLTLDTAESIVTLTDSTGDSGTHNDTLADGSTIGAALTDNSTGSAGDTIAAGVGLYNLTIPATFETGTGAADYATGIVLGHKFKLIGWEFITDVPGAGASASRVFNLEIGTTDVGTVPSTLTLTEASTSAKGERTAGTAIAGANTGSASDAISIEVAGAGTAFSSGSGYFLIEVQNMDTADAVASLAAKVNTLRTDNIVQNQNDSDLAQKVIEIVAALDTAGVTA
jgi:hypothetical protein